MDFLKNILKGYLISLYSVTINPNSQVITCLNKKAIFASLMRFLGTNLISSSTIITQEVVSINCSLLCLKIFTFYCLMYPLQFNLKSKRFLKVYYVIFNVKALTLLKAKLLKEISQKSLFQHKNENGLICP